MNKFLKLLLLNLISVGFGFLTSLYLIKFEWFSKGEAFVVFLVVFILIRNTLYLEEIIGKIYEDY